MRAAADRGRRPLLVLGCAGAAAAFALTGCAAGQVAQTARQTSVVDGTAFQAGAIDLRDVGLRAPGGPSYAKGDNAFLEGVVVNNGPDADQLVSVSSPDATGVQFYADGVSAVLGLEPSSSSSLSASASSSASVSGTPSVTGSATESLTPGATASPGGSTSASATTSATASGTPSGSPGTGYAAVKALQAITVNPIQAVQFGYQSSQVQIVLTGLTQSLAPAQTLQVTFTFAKAGSVTATIAVKLVTDANRSTPTVDTGKEGK